MRKVLNLTDAQIKEMRDQIATELKTDPMDGGVSLPDNGDGITRYPQGGDGGVISPEQMPDYEEPEQDGVPDDTVRFGNKGDE